METKRSAHKLNSREEILNAAYQLFLENGYHGTSMRPIARKAGISLGGIYSQFSSKEEIFAAIFYEFHPYREILEQLNQAQGEDLESLLNDAAQRFNSTILQKPAEFLKLLFIELVEFKAVHVAQFFGQLYPRLDQLAEKIFAGQPGLRPYQPIILLRVFLGLVFSYLMTEWMFGEQFPQKGAAGDLNTYLTIYLNGIRSETHEAGMTC